METEETFEIRIEDMLTRNLHPAAVRVIKEKLRTVGTHILRKSYLQELHVRVLVQCQAPKEVVMKIFQEMFEGEIRDGLFQFTITYHAYGVSTTDLNAALSAFRIGLSEARDHSKNRHDHRRSMLIRELTQEIKRVEKSIKIAEAEAKKERKKQKNLEKKGKGKSKKGENSKAEELEDEKEEETDKEKGAEKEDKVRTLDTVAQGVKEKSPDLWIPEKSDVGDGSCSSSAVKKNAIEPEQVRTLDTVEQVVKEKSPDLSIPEKSDVGDGSCSSSAVKKNAIEPEQISAKSSSTYSIDPEKRDTLYSGNRMISSRSSKKAFIPIESSELQDYEDIEALGFQHPNILALNDITESVIGDTPLVFLVAEDVDTIDWFFTRMFQKFVEDHEFSVKLIRSEWSLEENSTFMRSWWELIAKDFQIIFGDVVNGLLYLYSLGMPSGGLRDHIYVSGDKRGRILPLMDKMKTYKDDIVDLVKIMRDVIYQPRLQLGAKIESDYLPPELEHFLSFVKKEKLSSVSAAWLLDQPYFWSSPKRVNFMRKFRKCIQKLSINYEKLNKEVTRMIEQEFGENALWFNYLQDPMLIEIWQAGEKGIVKKYSANGDIVRFFIAVCSHANEKKLRGPKPIGDGVHEEIFRNQFPRIYTCLVNFIFECAQWKDFRGIQPSEALEWFLSSSDV